MKIACVLGPMFEDSEFKLPYDAFKQAGHEVTVIGLEAGAQLQGSEGRETATVERTFGQVSPEPFDALFIPGGSSPDKLRAHDEAVAFTRSFMDAGKPIFAICHGLQLLLTADTYKQHRMTAWKTVLEDLRKAGADVVDEEVVVDRNLVTSRKPDDIPAFIRESLKVIEGVPATRSVKYIASQSRMRTFRQGRARRAVRKRPDNAPEERLEADRRQLELLAAQCGEEGRLHRPLNDVVGGVITGIPEDTDLAQALSDRETTDILVHLLNYNREQVERALERLREGAYGICEDCARKIPSERLRFQPAATRCVECQGQWDRLNGRTA